MSCALKISCSLLVEEEEDISKQRKQHVQRPGKGNEPAVFQKAPHLCLRSCCPEDRCSWDWGVITSFSGRQSGCGKPQESYSKQKDQWYKAREAGHDLAYLGNGYWCGSGEGGWGPGAGEVTTKPDVRVSLSAAGRGAMDRYWPQRKSLSLSF